MKIGVITFGKRFQMKGRSMRMNYVTSAWNELWRQHKRTKNLLNIFAIHKNIAEKEKNAEERKQVSAKDSTVQRGNLKTQVTNRRKHLIRRHK